MNRRTIAVLCLFFLATCTFASCQSSEGEAADLSKSIERLLPRGSSYDSVVRFMEQRGIVYSNVQEVEGYDPSGNYGRQHVLTGTRVRSILGIEQSKVQLVFYFNDERQLSGSIVTPGKS